MDKMKTEEQTVKMSWDFNQIIMASILFWPLLVCFFTCLILAGIVFVIGVGSTLGIAALFAYGLYAALRDGGIIRWVSESIFSLKNWFTERVSNNIRQSFTVLGELEKLPRDKAVLFTCHPHGLYAMTWFLHFAVGLTDWPADVPRPKLAVHSIFFRIPMVRELFYWNHCIQATEEEILETLKGGESVAILVGGVEELNLTQEGSIRIILQKRKGYLRLAKRAGVPMVPLISLDEHELFSFSSWKPWRYLQNILYNWFRISLPLPSLRNVGAWLSLLDRPRKKPLETYVLKPVYPQRKNQKILRSEYLEVIQSFAKEMSVPIEIVQ